MSRKTRPSWDVAPEWANYLAKDEDGEWWWYEHKPKARWNYWAADSGRSVRVYTPPRSEGWRYAMEPRPNAQ